MNELKENVIFQLRDMARRGDSVGMMFKELKSRLGPDIVPLLEYMRSAFCLTVAEVKPIAALSRTDGRDVADEVLLQELVMPVIEKHRGEWDT